MVATTFEGLMAEFLKFMPAFLFLSCTVVPALPESRGRFCYESAAAYSVFSSSVVILITATRHLTTGSKPYLYANRKNNACQVGHNMSQWFSRPHVRRTGNQPGAHIITIHHEEGRINRQWSLAYHSKFKFTLEQTRPVKNRMEQWIGLGKYFSYKH